MGLLVKEPMTWVTYALLATQLVELAAVKQKTFFHDAAECLVVQSYVWPAVVCSLTDNK